MTKLLSTVAALPFLAMAGVAVADEAQPLVLDEAALDATTAGSFVEAFAFADAEADGIFFAFTKTRTEAAAGFGLGEPFFGFTFAEAKATSISE